MGFFSNLCDFLETSATRSRMLRWLVLQVLLHFLLIGALIAFTFEEKNSELTEGKKSLGFVKDDLLPELAGAICLQVFFTILIVLNISVLRSYPRKHHPPRIKLAKLWVFFLFVLSIVNFLVFAAKYGWRISPKFDARYHIPQFNLTHGAFVANWEDKKHATIFHSLGPDSDINLRSGPVADLRQWVGFDVELDAVKPVYPLDEYSGSCQIHAKERTFCNGSNAEDGLFTCNLRQKSDSPGSQICSKNDGTPFPGEGRCKLRAIPQTIVDRFYSSSESELISEARAYVESKGSSEICLNTCKYKLDTECDDGGANSHYDFCAFGSDCNDCGYRYWSEKIQNTKYYPKCGWDDTGENVFPQRHFARWIKNKRAVSAVSVGDSSSFPKVVSVDIPSYMRGNNVDTCIRACLLENYLNQHVCRFVQFNERTGECATIQDFENSCYNKDKEMFCPYLNFHHMSKKTSTSETVLAENSFNLENPWESINTTPKGNWTEEHSDWSIYILMDNAFVGQPPIEWQEDLDLKAALLVLGIIPCYLGCHFLIEMCIGLSSRNMVLSFTDVDWPFTLLYFIRFALFGRRTSSVPSSDFFALFISFTLTTWAMFLIPKMVTLDPSAVGQIWPIALTPLYIVGILLILATIGLVRVICGVNHTDNDLIAREYHYRTFLLFLCLIIPMMICLMLWTTYNGEDGLDARLERLLLPNLVGFGVHLLVTMMYTFFKSVKAFERWKLSQLEKMESEIRAGMREEASHKIGLLKNEFLDQNTSSERLAEILEYFAFHPKKLVSRDEVKELGQAKLAVLEMLDKQSMTRTWNRSVASIYGKALIRLSSMPKLPESPTSSRNVTFDDIKIPRYCACYYLLFRKEYVREQVEEYLEGITSGQDKQKSMSISIIV